MANLQLNYYKKKFKNKNFELKDVLALVPVQWIQCYGIKISDMDISFAQSLTSMSVYQKQVSESPAEDMCQSFWKTIKLYFLQWQDGDSQQEPAQLLTHTPQDIRLSRVVKILSDTAKKGVSSSQTVDAASSSSVHDEL